MSAIQEPERAARLARAILSDVMAYHAEQVRRKAAPEQRRESAVADVEAARIGAERRHHHAVPVCRKAVAADRVSAQRHTRGRMQMAGDLAVAWCRRGLVAKDEAPHRQQRRGASAERSHRMRIMIAGDPQPVAAALERGERRTVDCGHAGGPLGVMETGA